MYKINVLQIIYEEDNTFKKIGTQSNDCRISKKEFDRTLIQR